MTLPNLPFQRVLALAPHTDDVEFGAGGLVQRLLEGGATVRAIALSNAVKSLPPGFEPGTLEREFRAANRELGIPDDCVELADFPVRDFPSVRQEILEFFTALRFSFNPDLVLTPCQTDVHQDHQTCCMEAIRAFKTCTILGYELPWNTLHFSSSALVRLEERHAERKIKALSNYESQKSRPYAKEQFIRGWMHGRGVTVGAPYAEAFEIIRWVV